MRRRRHGLRTVLAVLGLGWLAGFGWFHQHVAGQKPAASQRTDGIVALTGGSGRVRQALRLLEAGRARRLLITGAHPATSLPQLAAFYEVPQHLHACCVDLGHAAGDTIGNAAETAIWAKKWNVRSLRLVTSDYHMPRSLLEFEDRLPGVRLVPDPVPGHAGFVQLANEYNKYLARCIWLGTRRHIIQTIGNLP